MYNNIKAESVEGKPSPLKFVGTSSGAIFIVTNNSYLEAGLTELALLYFVSPQKSLCIIDSTTFDSAFRLFEYLRYLETLSGDLNVLVINESIPNIPGNEKYCPWVCGGDISVNALKRVLINAANIPTNLRNVAGFYAVNLKRWKFSFTQSTIIDYLMKGLTVKEIAQTLDASPKTIYSSLRKVCIAHNQRSLIQLMHFLSVHETSFAFCKHPLTGRISL
ncbi:LuxR family transcriptional regulator [Enterobacter bugandensis]|uniref:helix-turn-helix transcriptional regulator n=1 Tax=Enterobacter bugandensis TaxID=881260 RepID=UPI0021CEA847|nr:LuxR family transcriptional regulator [Enterobacter bugandensis]MCU6162277.1 LuxR family transcriptional regulator [Enterobacter bugandensis]